MSLQIVEHPNQELIFNNARRLQPHVIPHNEIWFPNLQKAYDDVQAHYRTLPSATNPKDEQFSQRDCRLLTKRFMDFCQRHQSTIPDESLMREYMGELMQYETKTIVKYLVYARHFCKALFRQKLNPDLPDWDYRFMNELRQGVLNAAMLPNPKPKRKVEGEGTVWNTGKRLTIEEAQTILDAMGDDLCGLRDKAVFMAGFATGLRLSEIARITLASIKEVATGQYTVTVRAKGNKYFPRAIDRSAVNAIYAYVNAYNDQLPRGDARRIEKDTPIWRALTRTGNIFATPQKKMTPRGLAKIIDRRSLAPAPDGSLRLAAHDLRRCFAAWASQYGMKEEDLQMQMLHESLDTTRHYVGRQRDVSAQNIFNYAPSLH